MARRLGGSPTPVWLHQLLPPPANVGVGSQLYAASGSDVARGDYDGPSHWFGLAGLPKGALDEALAQKLWAHAEALTGPTFPFPIAPGSQVSPLGQTISLPSPAQAHL